MALNFMKRIFSLITLAIGFASCNSPKAVLLPQEDSIVEKPSNHRKYSLDTYDSINFVLSEITSDYFDHYILQTGETIKSDSSGKKQNGVLTLPLVSGQVCTKSDTGVSDGSSDSYVIYEYNGILPSIDEYYVLALGYESYNFFLINRHTGEETSVGSDPVVSPLATKIISFYIDDTEIAENLPIGFSVHEILNKKIKKEKEKNTTIYYQKEEGYSYYPDSKEWCWESENVLLLKFTYKGKEQEEHSDYLKLKIKK